VQTLARPGTVVVTDATLALVGDTFDAEPLGERQLKGISHAVALHEILPRSRAREVAGPSQSRLAPLVDRSEERDGLLKAWELASSGEGATVHISGDAGIGKTRLVEELRANVRDEARGERLIRCSPHYTSTPLYPVLQLLEQLIDLDRGEPAEKQSERLERWLASALPGATEEATALLADLLSISTGGESEQAMLPREVRNALLALLERLLVGDPATYPLLLIVEDLHWADPTTIELLERLIPGLHALGVASLFTFRRDFEPSWTPWVRVSEIDLGPLGNQDVRELVASSGARLDGAALRRIEEAAEGVPLFVDEMVKLLVEEPAGGAKAGVVPATLRGLMAERLDRLPQLVGVIDTAAVLGRDFEGEVLAALSSLGRSDFRSAVAQLTAQDVLKPVEGSRFRLEFCHALLQEVAYSRVLHRRRRLLHGQVAELLGSRRSPAWQAQPEVIAHHWSSAGQPEKALGYWERAGRRALDRASFLEAAEHFRRAVVALDEAHPPPAKDLERGELLTHWGASLQAGRTPAADVREIYTRARETYSRAERPERLVPVLRGQFLFHSARAEYGAAHDVAKEMLALGESRGRGAVIAEGHFDAGFAHLLRGDLGPARAQLEESIGCYEPPERGEHIYQAHPDTGVGARAYLATLLFHVGCVEEALAMSEKSVALAAEAGGTVTLALSWGMRCALLLVAGKAREFMESLESTRRFCVERNIGYWSDVCSMWWAWAAALNGDPGAHLLLGKQFANYLDSGGRVGIPHFAGLLAEGELAAGEKARALDAVRSAQEHIDATAERFYEPELQRLTAHVLMASPDPDAAAAGVALERAVSSAREQDANLLELRCAIALARHQRRVGEPGTAVATVASLVDWFGEGSTVPDVARGRALLEAREGAAGARDIQAG
jgi:tetratricopeptide (TPR) repeat protein